MDAPSKLRQVVWSNVWNWTNANGHGTRVHLTEAIGEAGKTLCGKEFPAEKGTPAGIFVCKRCLKKSELTIAQIRNLPWV